MLLVNRFFSQAVSISNFLFSRDSFTLSITLEKTELYKNPYKKLVCKNKFTLIILESIQVIVRMSSENDISCSFGQNLNEKCQDSNRILLSKFQKIDVELLMVRSGVIDVKDATLCDFHKENLLKRYSLNQKKCCNPFNLHKKAIPSRSNKGKGEYHTSMCI